MDRSEDIVQAQSSVCIHTPCYYTIPLKEKKGEFRNNSKNELVFPVKIGGSATLRFYTIFVILLSS